MIIYTYGGGDILYNLFQGIAKLHNGGFLKTLFAIGGMVGFTLAMLKTFFSNQSIGELVRSWFLPLVIGYGLIFLPRTHIMIKDIVTQNTKSVDNVPYGVSLIASLTSKIGYTITEGIETVLHTSHSPTYNKTGHIFAGEHMMDIANYTWENPTAEQNMRNFVVNCITYDVMLGRYSLDKLRSSNDLWPYIKERTSKNRGIYWIEASDAPHTKEPKYCSCRDAAVKLNDSMNSEVSKKQKNDLFKNLPGAFQALTAKSNAATTLLRQQLMLHSLVDGVESKATSLGLGHDFAVQRAYLQQQSTMHIAGGLAGKSVVIIRAIFEALILVSFIFVIPMLAFPNGLAFFGRWAEMVVWINFWPPIYAVLNFILQSAAQSRAAAIGTDLTLSTATPLANLYQDMVAYAGWASLFVPVLAYMILKGGMSSFVHIAGNMMQASQGAAGAAAQEQVTGNYSYGNVSMDNLQYNTASMNQQGVAAHLRDGYMQESTGNYDMTYGSDGAVMDQKVSHLPVSFSVASSLSGGFQRRAETSLQSAYSDGASYSSSIGDAIRELSSLDHHVGTQSSSTSGQTLSQDHSVQHSAQKVQSYAQDLSERYGISEDRAMQLMVGINPVTGLKNLVSKAPVIGEAASGFMDAIGLSGDVSYRGGASRNQVFEDAHRMAHSQDFQENMSKVQHFGEQQQISEGMDKSSRLSDGVSSSFEQARNHQKSMSQHLSASEHYSKQATYARDNSVRMDQNYNDQFWSFVEKKTGGSANAISVWESKEPWAEGVRQDMMNEFQSSIEKDAIAKMDTRISSDSGFVAATSGLAQKHDASTQTLKPIDRADHVQASADLKEQSGIDSGQIAHQKTALEEGVQKGATQVQTQLHQQQSSLKKQDAQMNKDFKESDEEWLGTKAKNAINPLRDLKGPSHKKEE
jgi:conjugal transfer mating pair stabilization protein TraG